MSEAGLRVIKRVVGKRVEVAGNATLQSLAEAPLREAVITLDVALLSNGCDGYLMRYQAADAGLAGSSWHTNVAAAEQKANELFGLRRSDWQSETPVQPSAPVRPSGNGRSGMPRRN